jgi:hypothetical protein
MMPCILAGVACGEVGAGGLATALIGPTLDPERYDAGSMGSMWCCYRLATAISRASLKAELR